MALAETINKPIDPFNIVGQVSRKPTVEGRGAEARRQLEPVMRATSQATTAAAQEEGRLSRERASKEGEIESQFAIGLETAEKPFMQAMAAMPERNVQDFDPNAGLEMAGLTALLGAFAGAAGGRAALKSMQGITEGYQQGKQDLYERETKQFETELQKYRDKIANAKVVYDNAIKLETVRRGAGISELKKLDPILQDSLITAKARANDLAGVGEMLKEAAKTGDQLASKLAQATDKTGSTDLSTGVGMPGYNNVLQVHGSGVPIAPINPYQGLDKKDQSRLRSQEFEAFKQVQRKDVEQAQKSREIIEQMDKAEIYLKRMASKGVATGGALGLPFGIGRTLQDIRTSTDPDASGFRTVAARLQREAYVPGEGQISNFERELFAQASIDLGRPVDTNYDLIKAFRIANQRILERIDFFDKYFAANRTMVGANELWNQYLDENRILTKDANGNIVNNPNVATSYEEYFRSRAGQPMRPSIGASQPTPMASPTPTAPQRQPGFSAADQKRLEELEARQKGSQ